VTTRQMSDNNVYAGSHTTTAVFRKETKESPTRENSWARTCLNLWDKLVSPVAPAYLVVGHNLQVPRNVCPPTDTTHSSSCRRFFHAAINRPCVYDTLKPFCQTDGPWVTCELDATFGKEVLFRIDVGQSRAWWQTADWPRGCPQVLVISPSDKFEVWMPPCSPQERQQQ
jgi:hypothetical protein